MTDAPSAPTKVTELSTGDQHLVLSIQLAHLTPERAFQYWTQPELLTKWWPQEADFGQVEDGEVHLAWPKMAWHLRGKIRRFVPGRSLAFTWNWDHEPELPERLVEVSFSQSGQGCSLTVTHGQYGTSETDQADRINHRDGWQYFLPALAAQTGSD